MRQTRAGQLPLVDRCVHVVERGIHGDVPACSPGLCHQLELALAELSDRPDMPRRMDDDFLSLERGVEVRNDPNLPALRVWITAFGKRKCLRRRPLLAALAERTGLEFLGGRRLEP